MINYSREFLRALFMVMTKIRLSEESIVAPIVNGMVKCPCHLCSGQEAISAGVCAALGPKDYVFGNHRSHGHYLAKGGSLKSMIAEIYGAETGCSRGRGGSMHLVDVDNGMLGSAPIVAGTISLAVGAALASKINRQKRVSISFFGDGATGEGALYESMNFAALKELPIVFVCENNFYSTHMAINECRPNRPIFEIGKPFGIKSVRIDGNDVLKVYETAKSAVESCRNGNGPSLIECLTYRLRGHVGPDDNIQGTHTDIRPKEEMSKWKRKDPIKKFERYLIKKGILGKDEIGSIKSEIQAEVEDAHVFAKTSPISKTENLTNYVFKK